jgi:hypothetical protein
VPLPRSHHGSCVPGDAGCVDAARVSECVHRGEQRAAVTEGQHLCRPPTGTGAPSRRRPQCARRRPSQQWRRAARAVPCVRAADPGATAWGVRALSVLVSWPSRPGTEARTMRTRTAARPRDVSAGPERRGARPWRFGRLRGSRGRWVPRRRPSPGPPAGTRQVSWRCPDPTGACTRPRTTRSPLPPAGSVPSVPATSRVPVDVIVVHVRISNLSVACGPLCLASP